MNNTGNIERLKVWQTIADAIRKDHCSHQWRRDRMYLLSALMKHHTAHAYDRDMLSVTAALEEVLSYLRNGEYLTHTDVKNGLSLFVLICTVQIDAWSPKPVNFAKAQAEAMDDGDAWAQETTRRDWG